MGSETFLKVAFNEPVSSSFFLLRLEGRVEKPLPGQFFMLKVSSDFDPFLRRPLAVARAENGWIEILYRLRGRGTKIMSTWKKGDKVSVLGPLGNGIQINERKTYLLIGGGSGVASLLYLAHELEGLKIPYLLCAGFQKAGEIPHREKVFSKLNVKIATEDGSEGFHGTSLDLAEALIQDYELKFLCGPHGMMRSFTERFGCENTLVLMESIMGCGTGVCMGCVVQTPEGPVRVCREGPVFEAHRIFGAK